MFTRKTKSWVPVGFGIFIAWAIPNMVMLLDGFLEYVPWLHAPCCRVKQRGGAIVADVTMPAAVCAT